MESGELARIWLAAMNDGELTEIERLRFDNLWIDLVNTQRSNFARAKAVGHDGLALQSALSVAVQIGGSGMLLGAWEAARPWNELVSADFVSLVEEQMSNLKQEGSLSMYRRGTLGVYPR